METRNITVVSTRDQKKTVVATDATTLAELKNALSQAGVDYEGMTFYEGLSHTELLSDDSILPHDVPYKGETTNELVFMLTNPNKKIRSGAVSGARAALYSSISERGLEAKCQEMFNKNMTNCSNAELLQVIAADEENTPEAQSADVKNIVKAIDKLVDVLLDADCILASEATAIRAILEGAEEREISSPYSDEEISNMFNFMD